MSFPQLASDQVSIVIRGHYNPAIFSPAWMLAQELIGNAEYSEAEVQIISPEVSIFEMAWLKCNFSRDTLQIATPDESEFERARDVTIGVLRALPHTPIAVLGINRESHFAVHSLEQWHHVGDILTPKEVWSDVLALPGMKEITIWGVRPDNYSGRVQVEVQPSVRIKPGIYIAYNDHYGLTGVDSQPESRVDQMPIEDDLTPRSDKIPLATEILANEFTSFLSRSSLVIERVAELAKEG